MAPKQVKLKVKIYAELIYLSYEMWYNCHIRKGDVTMRNKEVINKYIVLCNQGKTRNQIAEILGVTLRSVANYRITTGVEPASAKRKANLNEDYFSVIDTEEKVYILGFIFADGYLETDERTLTFNIHEKDLDILLKIKEALDCGNEVKKSSTKNCVRLHLSSVKLVSDLKKIGISRAKSATIQFPVLKESLYKHFIRGYFDGDGHIGNRQCALVIGSDSFYKGFNDYIKRVFNKELYTNDMGSYHRVQFNRRDHNIIKWIYKGSTIYLDRKYKRYLEYWDSYTERIRSRG